MPHRALRTLLTAVLFALAPAAHGLTHFVANNGVDGIFCAEGLNLCGSKENPCRSIACAIANAAAGDTIIVGPGTYGDLDGDGFPGEEGEELGSPGCDCMLSVNKPIKLRSSDGAAATVIDATSVDLARNVLISTNDGEFGKPGKGFTVTLTARVSNGSDGIVIDSTNVQVRGNQVVGQTGLPRRGILTVATAAGPVLIEGNQVIGWLSPGGIGIDAQGAGTTVRKNQVSRNGRGIRALGSNVVLGNVATGNFLSGIVLEESATAVGNAVYGNADGFESQSSGIVERNNVFGNRLCGLRNVGEANLPAANNYWGAATGPGPDPADSAGPGSGCDQGPGTSTIVTPFATEPFKVKARIKP